MKNKKILKFQIISIIFEMILGTLLHFTYEWSNENQLVGLFSAVNESTWEHLKLIFFPMLITTIIGYFYLQKENKNFLCAKTIGIISAMFFIVIFFYTYTGIIGRNYAFIDISIFFIAVILGEYITYKIIKKCKNQKCNKKIAIFILTLLFVCFAIFTYFPPQIGLFISPV